MPGFLPLLLVLAFGGQLPDNSGSIRGQVLNGSHHAAPVPEAEVVLQVRMEGQFSPVEQTVADASGRFEFRDLPVISDVVYRVGANHQDVHYPGERIQLVAGKPRVFTTVTVHDAVGSPNPLVIREHEIVIQGEPGALRVVEAMRVDNPSKTTYVGNVVQGEDPVTMRLGIPMDFARLTFDEEFYGRRFRVRGDHVSTGIPWTPGSRWLRFTYTIPNEKPSFQWRRTLQLPCEQLRVRVQRDEGNEVACSLAAVDTSRPGEAVFATAGETLPSGHVIEVTMGQLGRPWMLYARWSALFALVGLIATVVILRWPRRRQPEQPLAEGTQDSRHGFDA